MKPTTDYTLTLRLLPDPLHRRPEARLKAALKLLGRACGIECLAIRPVTPKRPTRPERFPMTIDHLTTDNGNDGDDTLQQEIDRLRKENGDLRRKLDRLPAEPTTPQRLPWVISEKEANNPHRRATAEKAARDAGRGLDVVPGDVLPFDRLKAMKRKTMPLSVKVNGIAAYGRKAMLSIPWE